MINSTDHSVIQHGRIVFFTWKNAGDWPVEYVSQSVFELLGYSPEDFLTGNITYADLIDPTQLERVTQEVEQAIAAELDEFTHLPYRLRNAQGQYLYVYDHTRIVRDANGEATHFLGYIFDETGLVLDSQRMQLVIDSTGVGIWDWDVQTGETMFNERWANIIGYTLDEISPVSIETWLRFAHDDDLAGSEAALKACWRGETDYYLYESRMHHKNGETVWVLDTGKVVEWLEPGVPKRMIGTHVDITQQKREQKELREARDQAEKAAQELSEMNLALQTEIARRKQAENKLNRLALYDFLTELPNRLYLENHFRDQVATAGSADYVLVFFDLNNFKELNDEYGHSVGDSFLVEVALYLKDCLADKGVVSRIGGDEFVAIVSIDEATLGHVMDELFENFASAISILEQHAVTLSAGISYFPRHSSILSELIRYADHAMYQAKRDPAHHYLVYRPE